MGEPRAFPKGQRIMVLYAPCVEFVCTSKYNHESYAAWAPMMDKTRSVDWL
jgi:hypothetical protein